MRLQTPEGPATVDRLAPHKERPDATMMADDSGRAIVAMLQKAEDKAKGDCARAMDLAHKLTLQLRAAEDRVRELEDAAAHFKDRANRAEDWLQHIHNEVEQTFFHNIEGAPRQTQKK